ncbi:putative transcription initiation factor brf1 [Schistosoma mansoni]|uniref:B-related factor 1 n=1 Tax=Schistosoma mansoni TaxID=6183 RepID=G4V9J2_SCHMA|nr:putative transcription initiation factor brf1 [Schistosoma mansoni]|eukprot:XP_018648181.1 putative transcription initiation factor brf1 [Schistosoma mansoni]
MKCKHCGCSNLEEDRARADLICLDCGMVLGENVISSEVEFVETSTGQCAAVGRFVSDESQAGNFKESRQATENKARRRIDTICGQLRLGNDTAASAFRYYQSALFRGLTRGRSAFTVAAGCIYLAARQLRVNLMLLDLSDAVGVNVYVLGRVYADLKKRLNLAIPEMDPCIYIDRFASQLEFGDKVSTVATTAMRLLQRMKKDWIATGRRPSGLAAAALLVAARIHEFNRTEEDVARIARISQSTARKRLEEFGRTPSSALSIEAFFSVDYTEEQDPPAFVASMKQEDEKIKSMSEGTMARITLEISELERRIDSELQKLAGKYTARTISSQLSKIDVGCSKGIHHLLAETDSLKTFELLNDLQKLPNNSVDCGDTVTTSTTTTTTTTPIAVDNVLNQSKTGQVRGILRDVLDGLIEPELLDSCVEDLHILTQHSGTKMCQLLAEAEEHRNSASVSSEQKQIVENADSKPSDVEETSITEAKSKDSTCLKLPVFISSTTITTKKEDKVEDDDTLYTEDIDDEELDREYLLQPREIMLKAAIWFKANAEHLELSRKRKLAKLQKQQQEQHEDTKGGPKKRRTVNRNNYTTSMKINRNAFSRTEDPKPISRKINYEALEAVVGLSTTCPSVDLINNSGKTVSATDVDNVTEPIPGPLLASTLCDNDNSKDLLKSPKHIRDNNKHKSITSMNLKALSNVNDNDKKAVKDQNLDANNNKLEVEEEKDNEAEGEEKDEENIDENNMYNSYLPNYSHGIDDDDEDDIDWSTGAELW